MRAFDVPLPIDAVLDELAARLRARPNAVLVAPPGAGKTTRVPLVLLDEPWVERRPHPGAGAPPPRRPRRRRPHGGLLGEDGRRHDRPRVRLDRKVSAPHARRGGHRGRASSADPQRPRPRRRRGGAVRRVARAQPRRRSRPRALPRPAARAAAGAAPPRHVRHHRRRRVGAPPRRRAGDREPGPRLSRSRPATSTAIPRDRLEDEVADAIRCAPCAHEPGSLLVFLPGQGEIRRGVERAAAGQRSRIRRRPRAALRRPRPPAEQDRAIAPRRPGRRKVVLATSIAETSLTIEGVRVVVDSGLARRAASTSRDRPHPARDRPRLPRRRRPAPRAAPAAPSRACATASGRRPRPARSSRSGGRRSWQRT